MSAPPGMPASAGSGTRPNVTLGPRLEIRDVEEAQRTLVDALNREGALRIDVSALGAVDTAGVQLLLALEREGKRRGLSIALQGRSSALERALALLGFGGAFNRSVP